MRRYITLPGVTALAQELVQVETFPDGETAITVPDIAPKDDIVLVGNCPHAQATEFITVYQLRPEQLAPSSD